MPTLSYIKGDRITFSFGSYEWITHYGLPIGMLSIGLIGLYSLAKDLISNNQVNSLFLNFNLPIFLIGILTYWLQSKKLKFKSFSFKGNLEINRALLRDLLIEDGWIIEHDNPKVLIANIERMFCSEQLILKIKTDCILWTAINHTANHNSFASQFCGMKRSNTIITKLKSVIS